jgi:hypothetical protein
MDTQATQHRQRIEETRAAMTAKLDLLEQHVSQKVAATVEQTVIAPVRGLALDDHQEHDAAPAVPLADHCGWGAIWLSAERRECSTD